MKKLGWWAKKYDYEDDYAYGNMVIVLDETKMNHFSYMQNAYCKTLDNLREIEADLGPFIWATFVLQESDK